MIIPFRHTIPEAEQDKCLAEKIKKTELAGVLNWVVRGLKRLMASGQFTESEIAAKEVAAYKRDSDSVASFIDDCEAIPRASLKQIYLNYRSHCCDVGCRPLGRNNFAKRLETHGYFVEKTRSGMVITRWKDG